MPNSEVRPVFHTVVYAVSVLVITNLGEVYANILPMWWALLARERGYDLLSFGMVQTAQVAGWALMNILLLLVLKRLPMNRVLLTACLVQALAFASVPLVQNVYVIIGGSAVLSATGACIMSLGYIYLGHAKDSTRYYSIQAVLIPSGVAACMYSLPVIHNLIGNDGVQYLLAGLLLCAGLAAGQLPSRAPDKKLPETGSVDQGEPVATFRIWPVGVPMLLAYTMHMNYPLAIFNFSQKTAELRGISIEDTGAIFAVALIVGSLLGFLGVKILRKLPKWSRLTTPALLGIVMTLLFARVETGWIGFAIGTTLFGAIFNMVYTFLMAQIMEFDPGGRLLVACALVGSIAGTFIAAGVAAVSLTYGISQVFYIPMVELLALPCFVALALLLHARRDHTRTMLAV